MADGTTTLLNDGRVLVVGGSSSNAYRNVAMKYDPATNRWRDAGRFTDARRRHTATLLPNGKVLIAGGEGDRALSSASLYDPATNSWSDVAPMGTARYGATATLLPERKGARRRRLRRQRVHRERPSCSTRRRTPGPRPRRCMRTALAHTATLLGRRTCARRRRPGRHERHQLLARQRRDLHAGRLAVQQRRRQFRRWRRRWQRSRRRRLGRWRQRPRSPASRCPRRASALPAPARASPLPHAAEGLSARRSPTATTPPRPRRSPSSARPPVVSATVAASDPPEPTAESAHCTHWVTVGRFTHADAAGPNSLRFTGRLGGHKLAPAVTASASARGSAVASRVSAGAIGFRIVR